MPTIKQIAKEINNRSKNFEIGKLQEQRTKIKNLNRQPGEKIFNNNTIFDEYAFHYGGRKELQYNIGKENDTDYRHGVAFSLERSQTLPDPTEILYPKIKKVKGLVFSPGHTIKKKATKVTKEKKDYDVELRHNLIQDKLYNLLAKKYGKESVGTERPIVGGDKVDLVVKLKAGVIYYEIKTALTAKTSIRESLSQLLEYSYWPERTEASKLVIASESLLDNEAEQYLKTLRQKFSIPIYYEQVKIN